MNFFHAHQDLAPQIPFPVFRPPTMMSECQDRIKFFEKKKKLDALENAICSTVLDKLRNQLYECQGRLKECQENKKLRERLKKCNRKNRKPRTKKNNQRSFNDYPSYDPSTEVKVTPATPPIPPAPPGFQYIPNCNIPPQTVDCDCVAELFLDHSGGEYYDTILKQPEPQRSQNLTQYDIKRDHCQAKYCK